MQQCNYEVYADTNLFNYILAKSSDNKNDVKKNQLVFPLIQLVNMAACVMMAGIC